MRYDTEKNLCSSASMYQDAGELVTPMPTRRYHLLLARQKTLTGQDSTDKKTTTNK